MAYLDTHRRTTKPTKNDLMQPAGRMPALFGVFVGFVKDAADVLKNGRLRVWIPEMGSAPNNPDGWTIVNYCSPFAGATNVDTASAADIQTFEGTQTSYGMWMIPPDINNQVLIMFINGDPSRGIWIGCLFNQFMNNMVPGMAASTNNYQYPGKDIPAAEYNKNDTKVTKADEATKPYEATKFKGLGNQGLITDPIRGVTTSSARRESPSKVFGILTPGPAIDPITEKTSPENIRRKGGSSFIMDDADNSEYVKLATKSGAQITLNETTGDVYLINRDGTAWVQTDAAGNIDIFGATNISMRAQKDINLRADRNINIEAGQNIFMKAAQDTTEETTAFTYDVNNIPKPSTIPVWNYVGEGNGDGGNIVMQALNNWQSTTRKSAFLSVIENNMEVKIGNTINVTTDNGGQNFNSKLGIKMTTDAAFDFAATGNIRVGSNGIISVVGANGIVVCTDANLSLNAGANLITASAGSTSMHATIVQIDADVNMNALNASSVKSNTIAYDGQALAGGSPTPPAPENTASAEAALSANPARPAEVKPLNNKLNIRATWQDPDSKFKRNSQEWQTTVSGFPTYEPCPEHRNFSTRSVSTTSPLLTPDDKTYQGSSGAGNTVTTAPPPAINAGSNNTSIKGDPLNESSVAKDVNVNALRCQLIIHEGLKTQSYLDTGYLLTGGIGHLMRANEIPLYPAGTPISTEQVEIWYTQDSASAIKIAQEFMNSTWGDLSDIRKRAMIDLAYNMGKGRLGQFNNFIAAMRAKSFIVAGQELRNSKWFTQVGKRGPNIVMMVVQDIDPNRCDQRFPE